MPKKLDYNIIFYVVEFLIFATLIIFVFPHSRDDGTLRHIRRTGVKNETERAVIWVEKGYLDQNAIQQLGLLIDKGINDAEAYLGIKFNPKTYGADKIAYVAKSGNFDSHLCSDCILYKNPYIFLSGAYLKTSSYLLETVKLISGPSKALWLNEGLSIYLNDKLGGWPAYPNFGKSVDEKSFEYFQEGNPVKYIALELFKKIGENNKPDFNAGEFELYCVISASFVKYLDKEIGIRPLMYVYMADDPKDALLNVTGKSVEMWKESWFKSVSR
jgi:hypothetical protein